MNHLDTLIQNCFTAQESKNIPALQNHLFILYSTFNKQGCGTLIVNYPDKMRLGECLIMMLIYDWMNDDDIREVWAENAFYCLGKYICDRYNSSHKDNGELAYASFDMFILLRRGKHSLKTKFNDIIRKSEFLGIYLFDKENYTVGADSLIVDFLYLSVFGTLHYTIHHQDILKKILPYEDDRLYYANIFNELMEKPLKKGASHLVNQVSFICYRIEDVLIKM